VTRQFDSSGISRIWNPNADGAGIGSINRSTLAIEVDLELRAGGLPRMLICPAALNPRPLPLVAGSGMRFFFSCAAFAAPIPEHGSVSVQRSMLARQERSASSAACSGVG
jgi:hypothetical protein